MAQQASTKVVIGGKDYNNFHRLSINQRIDWHHQFEIVFPYEAIGTGSSVFDISKDLLGKEVEVVVETEGNNGFKQTGEFKGVVTNLRMDRQSAISKKAKPTYQVILSGLSLTAYLDGNPHTRSFEKKKVSDMANEMFKNAPTFNHTVEVETDEEEEYFVQYKETNYAFLNRIATLYGHWCYYDGTELIFGKVKDRTKSIDLPFEKDLLDFDVSLSLQPLNFEILAHDYVSEDEQLYKSEGSSEDISGELDELGKHALSTSEKFYKQKGTYQTLQLIESQEELDRLNKRKKSSLGRRLSEVSGISDNPQIKVGSVFNITEDKEENYDFGKYLIIDVMHSVDALGGYQNSFSAIPFNATSPPPNTNIGMPICEVQPAIVKDNKDDKKLGRVKVQFIWQKEGEMSNWIKIMQPHASQGEEGELHGFYFIPEIGDQVMVAFEDENPSKPYVLGSFYHGKAKPDEKWVDDTNKNKIIKTRNGNQIQFIDDEGKEVIKILNKNAEDAVNEITLEMEGDGKISIKTKGDLVMDAKSIEIKSQEGISMEAGTETSIKTEDLKMQSTNTEMNATDMKMEASSTSIKSSGQLEIEGGASKIKASTLTVDGGGSAEVKAGIIKLN